MQTIRKPAVAGMFYPASKEELSKQIKQLLDVTKTSEKFENIAGIISPHAGYIYSGKTAAFAYNTVTDKNYENVVVISPSHREYFPGISIYDGDAYSTPLGTVPVNNEIREQLIEESKSIFKGINGHGNEHALEVQIPFLQTIFPDFTIVPIVMGDQGKVFVDELGEKLSEIINDKTLIVASSDLSHFYSKEHANELDSRIEKRIEDFDYDGLLNDLAVKNCEACGGGGIASLMKAAELQNIKKSKVLSRKDSGDVTGDNSEVVGYLSAVIYD